jgi:hypothetical protein
MKYEAASCNRQTEGSDRQRGHNEYGSNCSARGVNVLYLAVVVIICVCVCVGVCVCVCHVTVTLSHYV